jgi:hypothetical protein
MKFESRSIFKTLLLVLPLSAISTIAAAQIEVQLSPPDSFIATTEPVYYGGHPAYYYNGHWYYRDAQNRWNYYHDEPAELRDHRMHAPPARHFEERHAPPPPRGRR